MTGDGAKNVPLLSVAWKFWWCECWRNLCCFSYLCWCSKRWHASWVCQRSQTCFRTNARFSFLVNGYLKVCLLKLCRHKVLFNTWRSSNILSLRTRINICKWKRNKGIRASIFFQFKLFLNVSSGFWGGGGSFVSFGAFALKSGLIPVLSFVFTICSLWQ